MFITINKIIILFPFLILPISILIIMCSILFKRNHIFVLFASICSLFLILLFLPILYLIIPVHLTSLLYVNFYSLVYIFIIVSTALYIIYMFYFYIDKFFIYQEELYLLMLSSVLGAILLVCSNHLISMFIGIEMMSIPIIGIMTYSLFYKKCIKSILKYIILSSVSSIVFVLGILVIYLVAGNLNFNSIKICFLLNSMIYNKVLLLGIIFLFISMSFKLSLFPFHFWISDIYKNHSSFVLTYMSTIMKISIVAILVRLFLYIPDKNSSVLCLIIELFSVCSIIFGSIMALFQNNIKKLLGYSSITHIGYSIAPLFMIRNFHVINKIVLLYLINYVISSIAMFSILCLLELCINDRNVNSDNLFFYKGFIYKKPVLTFVMTIIIFSLLGIPITFGFITKFYIIFLSIYQKYWLLYFSILVNSGLGIYYYLKILLNLYTTSDKKHFFVYGIYYKSIEYFIYFFGLLIILLGIFPQILINRI